MKNKFYMFNGIIFIILLFLFITSYLQDSIQITYHFAGNNIFNQHSGETHHLHVLILQSFTALGMLVQLIFVNLYMLKEKRN